MQSCFGCSTAPLQFSPGKITNGTVGGGVAEPDATKSPGAPLVGGGVSVNSTSVIVAGSGPTSVTVAVLTCVAGSDGSESNTLSVSTNSEFA